MDPMYHALTEFYRHQYDMCIKICTEILDKHPNHEAAWLLKMQALTENAYIDDILDYQTNITDFVSNEKTCTNSDLSYSLKNDKQVVGGLVQAMRPSNNLGKPTTGVVVPRFTLDCKGSIERAVRTGRVMSASRPLTSAANKKLRIGTAYVSSNGSNDEFIHVARMNLSNYSNRPEIARPLFEYLFYVVHDIRSALNLINFACGKSEPDDKQTNKNHSIFGYESSNHHLQVKDWWWALQKARCLYHLGLVREAQTMAKESINMTPSIEAFLLLGLIAIQFDQPHLAIQVYEQALVEFPKDVDLLTNMARLYERLEETNKSIALYRNVVETENTNTEGLASIAMFYFYDNQPEVALKFYRRILQTGLQSSELYNNLGLCAFFSQQYDSCISFFNEALALSDADNVSDIYYNLAHVATSIGDLKMAYQCLRIAITQNNNHAEAYNNLGVIEQRRGNLDMARSFYQTASDMAPTIFEPYHNLALLTDMLGELQSSYQFAKRALDLFPNHSNMKHLLTKLNGFLTSV